MEFQNRFISTRNVVLSVAIVGLANVAAVAQKATVEGLIIGRNGPTMSVKTETNPRVTVVLSDTTKAT